MRAFVISIILALAGTPAAAQLRTPGMFASSSQPPPRAVLTAQGDTVNASTSLLALGGIAGGALGLIGGAYLGYLMVRSSTECESGEFLCEVEGVGIGAVVGETTMLPLGVHLVNGSRGPYFTELLASGAFVGAALLVSALEPGLDESLTLAVPIGQLITVVLIERAATRAPR